MFIMKKYNYIAIVAIMFSLVTAASCNSDDDTVAEPKVEFSGIYGQVDQMGRPAINTVLIGKDNKDAFNVTVPTNQAARFGAGMKANLEGLSPAFSAPDDRNLLQFTSEAFIGVLSTDVLSVSTTGVTTFFDGTNVLTGRALGDDVIDVELILIFGGEDAKENPTLTSDNVDSNDKEFLAEFPYLAAPW